jgi:hypothetical protein
VWYLRQHPKVQGLPFKPTVKRQARVNARVAYIDGDLTPLERIKWESQFVTVHTFYTQHLTRIHAFSQFRGVVQCGAVWCSGGMLRYNVFTHLFIHSCIHSFIHPCIHSCIRSFVHSLQVPPPLTAAEKTAFLGQLDGVSLSSDAFFPFRDSIDHASKVGVKYIVQPGGSVGDTETIEACDQYGMAMAFSNFRLFHH